jgi:hypothetical protein
LILASLLILIGVQLWVFGLVADLLGVNRKMLEDIQLRMRRVEFDSEKRDYFAAASYSGLNLPEKK